MADNKEIRIGVDPSGVKQYEGTVVRSNEAIKKSIEALESVSKRSYNTTKRAILEEIELLEKRNRLLYEKKTGRAASEYQEARQYVSFTSRTPEEAQRRGEQAFAGYRGQMASVGSEYQQQKEQTKLLRELIDTVKAASKDEVRQESINNEHEKARFEMTQAEIEADDRRKLDRIGGTAQSKEIRESQGSIKSTGKRWMEFGIGAVESRSGLDLASRGISGTAGVFEGMGGIGGIIGMLAALTVGKLIGAVGESVSKYGGNLGEYSRYGGKGVREMKGFDLDIKQMSKYGMTASEWFGNNVALRAGGKIGQFGESATNLMNISKGTPLSQGDVIGLLGLKRFGGSNVSPEVAFFEKYLRKTHEDISVLPEIISQFTKTATTVISQTGRTDTTGVASMLAGFGMQTGFKGDVLSSTFGKIEAGFHRSSNPVIQAMQFRAARQSGAKTVWEAEKIMESPLSNPQYMSTVLQNMRNVSGGGEKYERAISNVFGINPNLAAGIAKWDITKGVTPEMLKTLQQGSVSFDAAAERTVGEVTGSAKNLESTREVYGFRAAEAIAKNVTDLVDKVRDLVDVLTKSNERLPLARNPDGSIQDVAVPAFITKQQETIKELAKINVSGAETSEALKKISRDGIKIIWKDK